MKLLLRAILMTALLPILPALAEETGESPLLGLMQRDLTQAKGSYDHAAAAPLYFAEYAVTEQRELSLKVRDGGSEAADSSYNRYLDVDLRVGSPQLDNTHEIRSNNFWDNYEWQRSVNFPLSNDSLAICDVLWAETEYQFQKAEERYTKVTTNKQVKVEAEDRSDDFSVQTPSTFVEPVSFSVIDTARWQPILKRVGSRLAAPKFVLNSSITLHITDQTNYIVNSEGSKIQQTLHFLRVMLSISAKADDGMDLQRYDGFEAATPEALPDEATLTRSADSLLSELKSLLEAPLVEPYSGPAILRNRASGVFFHEIFGHRVEGHRQKASEEGQTFTKKVGQQILPAFLSVYDDPTIAQFRGKDLHGYYKFDDEGTPAQRVTVVENGVLKNFLMSRSPIQNFTQSNGHGRREYGNNVVSRQGNLIVSSSNSVPFSKLREMLIEECKKANKPYGLIFDDISGGFTMTRRWTPQAFKIRPLMVHRIYADGRPDEVVRGVDVVGTPLTAFGKILATGDDDDIFNGYCGAESGSVPVAAISPSILISEIEVEKKQKGQEKPPILPPPSEQTQPTR